MAHFSLGVLHKPDQDVGKLLTPYLREIEIDPRDNQSWENAIYAVRMYYRRYKKASNERCQDYIIRHSLIHENGLLYFMNPWGYIETWEKGGRWREKLKLLNHAPRTYSANVRDIDFSPDQRAYELARKEWDSIINSGSVETIQEYGDQETYARSRSCFQTHAVITPDGKWHKPVRRDFTGGQFAYFIEYRNWDDNFQKRFIDTADPDWILTIVDCFM